MTAVSLVPEFPGATRDAVCLHCGGVLAARDRDGFCCTGCRVVHGLLSSKGLTRYYDLRGSAIGPATPATHALDTKWLDALETELAQTTAVRRMVFDLQGVQCAACVWLIEALFEQTGPHETRLSVSVNPAIGRVELLVRAGFPLHAWVNELARFGYQLGPARKREAPRSSALLWRIGVCAALAMNAMIFSAPVYLGLREGAVHTVFRTIAFLCATGSVAFGGSVFFASAWRCVRRGVAHLDIPIALGIALAYVGSLWHFFAGRDRGTFFDTVAVFVALMLTGRWLQERVVERNRAMLLASDGVDGLLARRVRDDVVTVVPCREVLLGDVLLIAPGDLVPVAATLASEAASCSLDWITGEATPRAFVRGEQVPAGAFNLGVTAINVRADEDFAASPLPGLLRSTHDAAADVARATSWWQRLTRVYVVSVLGLAASCLAMWWGLRGDLTTGLQATTALLVVTCPCALGLATPTAYEMTLSGLRRAGMFVRSSSLLDRLLDIRRVVFDKTGTLTEGALTLVDPARLRTLDDTARTALFNLVVRSTHPRSVAVRRALETIGCANAYLSVFDAHEAPGDGIEANHAGDHWRFGRAPWATGNDSVDEGLCFARNGVEVMRFETAEVIRPDAHHEVAALTAMGIEVWMLSGDDASRVRSMATSLGIPEARAIGGATPDDKARWIMAHDRRDTWMIGDGINDGPAVEAAFCSATPAIDRPFMPARVDAWFTTAGLRPVRLALLAARALRVVNRRNLVVATAYNIAAVALAFMGVMSPLVCAVVMPLTSLSILAATIAALSSRRSLWRS